MRKPRHSEQYVDATSAIRGLRQLANILESNNRDKPGFRLRWTLAVAWWHPEMAEKGRRVVKVKTLATDLQPPPPPLVSATT